MNGLRLTPLARLDLRDIEEYIARDNPDAAANLIKQIRNKCEFLAKHPEAGSRRNRLRPGLRGFPIGNYIIFYRIVDKEIEVIRVLHGARDLPNLFQ